MIFSCRMLYLGETNGTKIFNSKVWEKEKDFAMPLHVFSWLSWLLLSFFKEESIKLSYNKNACYSYYHLSNKCPCPFIFFHFFPCCPFLFEAGHLFSFWWFSMLDFNSNVPIYLIDWLKIKRIFTHYKQLVE